MTAGDNETVVTVRQYPSQEFATTFKEDVYGPCSFFECYLRKGSIFVAVFGILLAIACLGFAIGIAVNPENFIEGRTGSENGTMILFLDGNYTIWRYQNPHKISTVDALTCTSTILMIVAVFGLLLFSVLICGAICKIRFLCVLWVWSQLVLSFCTIVAFFMVALVFGRAYIPFVPLAVNLVAAIYFILVVLAYCQLLADDPDSKENKQRLQDGASDVIPRAASEGEMLTTGIYGWGHDEHDKKGSDAYPIHPVVAAMKHQEAENQRLASDLKTGSSHDIKNASASSIGSAGSSWDGEPKDISGSKMGNAGSSSSVTRPPKKKAGGSSSSVNRSTAPQQANVKPPPPKSLKRTASDGKSMMDNMFTPGKNTKKSSKK